MFASNMKVSELLEAVRNSTDISIDVTDGEMLVWLNAMEQMLYSELIKEQHLTEIDGAAPDDIITFDSLARDEGEADIEERDIVVVAADNTELDRISGGVGVIWHSNERPSWYPVKTGIQLCLKYVPDTVYVAHVVRPEPYTVAAKETDDVRMVAEFVPMYLARLRGEMYKLANEQGLSAQWIGEYNTELENFKVWNASHDAHFGG